MSLLGAKDRFRLLTADVRALWYSEDARPVSEEEVEKALAFLDRRDSLGWTDLDLAFAQVAKEAGDGTLVVYVGDGIGTTGDADPVALAQRLRAHAGKGVFHAVSTSSTYERGVLEAVAAIGGG